MASPSKRSNPYLEANIISRWFQHWVSPLLGQSHKKGVLHLDDLYDLSKQFQASEMTNKLESNWFDELKQNPSNPSLIRATLRTIGWKPFLLGLLSLLYCIMQLIQSLLLTLVIDFFEPCSTMSIAYAWFLVGLIIFVAFFSSILVHQVVYQTDLCAIQMFVSYTGIIYRKVLRLSSHSTNAISSGEIINLLSNDPTKIRLLFYFVNYLWVAPIQTILVTIVFWHFVKYIAFVSIGYSIFLLVIQPLFGRIFIHLKTKALEMTDERVQLMAEIIKSMRIVKMYCWESAFIEKICLIRKKEIIRYTIHCIIENIQMLFAHNYSNVTFLMMYAAMWSINIKIDTRFFAIASCTMGFTKVFVVEFFSNAIRDLSEYLAARKRIEKFLLMEECQRDIRLLSSSNLEIQPSDNTEDDIKVVCDVEHAQWDEDGIFALKKISFGAKPGDIICIIGPVGSGKSSLLQTLTGEIAYFDGKVRLNGSFCYVPQEAWIFSSTIKNNILFGLEYNHRLFQRVIRATALDIDFEQLPHGANTLVGDHGVMLSGGQKARVNMARALYRNADIYLLDDPLSAVDVKVSKHLFQESIRNYLSKKICILVTHQIQFLQHATKIIVLNNGEVSQMGTYCELIESPTFAHYLRDIHQHEQEVKVNVKSQLSVISSVCSENGSINESMVNHDTKQEGSIKLNVYLSYIKAGLGCLMGAIFLLILYTAHQAAVMYGSWWLAKWSDDEGHRSQDFKNCTTKENKHINTLRSMSHDQWTMYRNKKMYIYSGIVFIMLILTFLRTFFAKIMCLNAGRVLHNKMFQRVIRCPISFFDMNPIGRILNRFTRDILLIDTEIVADLPDFLECAFSVMSTVVLVGILNYWSLIPTLLGIIGMLIIRHRFARGFRDLKRLEGITRSPVYSYAASTIHGLKVIRSHHAEKMCSEEFLQYLDDNSRTTFLVASTERWAAIRFDCITFTFLTLVTVFSVVLRILQQEISTADIALIFSYSLNLMGLFQWTIRQSVTVETEMTAVERILEYCSLVEEKFAQVPMKYRPPVDWPSKGEIKFDNVSMTYENNESQTFCLRDMSLRINAHEKVGIVGRTGAGKSSFIQGLFRMARIVTGQIKIDNIDISTIGLDDLRSRISIIPQDPVLFTGTVRANLDPFKIYSDRTIWNALEEVQLKNVVSDFMDNGLDSFVSENGSNLSVGQKQLVCLGRAILKKSKILVIDEATANVDNATDELIQTTIRNKFKDCTVLTVAHRLRTIIDSDRIMVLNNGELVEFDTPFNLLSNPKSYFTSLVEQTGPSEAKYLRTLANRQDFNKEEIIIEDDIPLITDETDPLLTPRST